MWWMPPVPDARLENSGATDMIKTGRPRLDDNPGFKEAFATILPRLVGGEISQGQAARELDISVRSLKRYVIQGARDSDS